MKALYIKDRLLLFATIIFIVCIIHSVNSQHTCPSGPKTRVLLLGDSWAHIMWNNRTYRDVFDQFGFADIFETGTNTAIGGTTAWQWAQPANLSILVHELQQHPDLDVVIISIGGNDLLAGINGIVPGWHTGLSSQDETLLFDRIQADMQIIVDAIKAVRPSIEVVFSGYDYINLFETIVNNPANALLWANLGQPTPLQINTAFTQLELRKIIIANTDPRVHYAHSMGLMQHIYGYPNIFPAYYVPAPGLSPPHYHPFPGGDINFPTPPIALANNGNDAIHLSDEGYRHLAVNQMVAFLHNKLRGYPQASFRSEGNVYDGWIRSDGNLAAGNLRMGDHHNGSIYRSIVSFNTAALPDNAIITGASLYINRASLSGQHPFLSGTLGLPVIDIKEGTFGAAQLEILDFLDAADVVDAGCFVGTAPNNGYTIRIDLKPIGYNKINKTGRTQFRLYFPASNGNSTADYVQFHNGDQPGLYAPYLDVFYTLPPPPAQATLWGDTTICYGAFAQIHVTLTGTPPFSLVWSDGYTEFNINNYYHIRTLSPQHSTTYHLNTVTDANGTGSVAGTATVNVLPQISVSVAGLSSNYCINSPAVALITTPPNGTWMGPGIDNQTFIPRLAAQQNGGSGTITLTYSGIHLGCAYSQQFPVYVDSDSCALSGSCTFSEVSGTVSCVGRGPVTQMYESSGQLWVFEGLIAGRTYVASTCDSCGYDSHLMIRDEADSVFIKENDDACGQRSSVTFVAPTSGRVGINLTSNQSYSCNPYLCNPYDCDPFPCNPYPCHPYTCNCQTCYQTCYQDELVYMTCYPSGIQFINGHWTSDCIGACTGGFCWRMRYQVPYNCNPYTCNCQTCYQTCYDQCYQTCYDTCYTICSDQCGSNNTIPCYVTLVCIDCQLPTATIWASNTQVCINDMVSFLVMVTDTTCTTNYLWDFGPDAMPATSTELHPPSVRWTDSGTKQISLTLSDASLGSSTYYTNITVHPIPTGGRLISASEACMLDTLHILLDSVSHATGYYWHFGNNTISSHSNIREVVVTDSTIFYLVIPHNNFCTGDTFSGIITTRPSPSIMIYAPTNHLICAGDTVVLNSNMSPNSVIQWMFNGIPLMTADDSLMVTEAGVYTAIATDSNGCEALSNAISIGVVPVPDGTISGNTNSCVGRYELLEANYRHASTYQWFINDSLIPQATDSALIVTQSGNYKVIASNNYCEDTSEVFSVHFHSQPPAPVIDITGDSLYVSNDYISYEWYHNGSLLAGIQEPAIAIFAPGEYYVEVSDSNGCKTVSDTIYIQWTNINNSDNTGRWIIYPNPVQENIFILVKNVPLPAGCILYDALGRKITTYKITDDTHVYVFSVDMLTSGLYFLKTNEGEVYKLIKK